MPKIHERNHKLKLPRSQLNFQLFAFLRSSKSRQILNTNLKRSWRVSSISKVSKNIKQSWCAPTRVSVDPKTWDRLGSPGIIYLGSSGIVWDHLGSSGRIWDHLGSSGKSLGWLWGGIWDTGGRRAAAEIPKRPWKQLLQYFSTRMRKCSFLFIIWR